MWVKEIHPVFIHGEGWSLSGNHYRVMSFRWVKPHGVIPESCLAFVSTSSLTSCPLRRPPSIPQISWYLNMPIALLVLEGFQEFGHTVCVNNARELGLYPRNNLNTPSPERFGCSGSARSLCPAEFPLDSPSVLVVHHEAPTSSSAVKVFSSSRSAGAVERLGSRPRRGSLGRRL